MAVEADESYVVNDIVVHNCKCHIRPVVTDSPQAVTQQLRALELEDRRRYLEPVMTPAAMTTLLEQMLGNYLLRTFGQMTQGVLF